MPAYKAVRELIKAPHSRYPVMGDSADDIIGFVHVRDLLDPEISSRTTPVSEATRPVLSMPDTVRVLRALSEMRRSTSHLAIVLDEYGGTAGIVTLEDLVEELIGDITDEYDIEQDHTTRLPAGDVEVDGLLNLDEFAEQTGLELPEGPYETAAGYVLSALGALPSVGDTVPVVGRTITVTELDGRRIARLRVTASGPASASSTAAAGQVRLDSEAPHE